MGAPNYSRAGLADRLPGKVTDRRKKTNLEDFAPAHRTALLAPRVVNSMLEVDVAGRKRHMPQSSRTKQSGIPPTVPSPAPTDAPRHADSLGVITSIRSAIWTTSSRIGAIRLVEENQTAVVRMRRWGRSYHAGRQMRCKSFSFWANSFTCRKCYESSRKPALPRQQRYSRGYQRGRDPSPSVDFLVKENSCGDRVADKGKGSSRWCDQAYFTPGKCE